MSDRLVDRVRQNRDVKTAARRQGAGLLRRMLFGGGDEAVEALQRSSNHYRTIDGRGHVINDMPTKMLMDLQRQNQYGYGRMSTDQLRTLVKGGPQRKRPNMLGYMAFGSNPIWSTRQRMAQGGLLGKGGLIQSELAWSPRARQAYRNLSSDVSGKSPFTKAWQLGMHGGMDAVGKGIVFGMPATAGYRAIKNEGDPSAGRFENLGRGVGDGAGWLAGSPAGVVGGIGAAYAGGNIASRVGGSIDRVLGTQPKPQGRMAQLQPRGRVAQPHPYQRAIQQAPATYHR